MQKHRRTVLTAAVIGEMRNSWLSQDWRIRGGVGGGREYASTNLTEFLTGLLLLLVPLGPVNNNLTNKCISTYCVHRKMFRRAISFPEGSEDSNTIPDKCGVAFTHALPWNQHPCDAGAKTITGESEAIGNPQKNREWRLRSTVPENNLAKCSAGALPICLYTEATRCLFHIAHASIRSCEDHILQSNQLITFFFPVADNWVSSAKPLGSRPSYGQTFPAKELVIVVKAFPITTTDRSQEIWGTAQNNKVVVVTRMHL